MKLLLIPTMAIFLSISFLACNGPVKQEEKTSTEEASGKFNTEQLAAQQEAWDKVMVIHDEVMPKMGAMHSLTKALKENWETNDQLDAAAKDSFSIAIQEMESADEGMWDWMHKLKQLKPLRESESHEAILTYLGEQEQSMILVREAMVNSMTRAEELLKDLEG